MIARFDHPRRLSTLTLTLLAVVLIFLVILSIGIYLSTQGRFSILAIEEALLAWGAWGVAASIGLMVMHSFVPFPAEALAIANGMVYGPLWGIAITWTGAMLGAFLAFGLARLLGRPFVEVVVARRNWHLVDDWTGKRGGRLILIGRLIPVIAFNLINYAAGLSRVSWWTFTWATAIGILPMVTLMVLIGDAMELLEWEAIALLIVAVFVLPLLFHRAIRRARHRRETE